MTGRTNTKLAWVVGAAVLWAWAGLYLALGTPEADPVFALGLEGGKAGVLVPGRLAELIEDEQGIRLKLDAHRGPNGPETKPKLPDVPRGITVEYLDPAQRPMPPRIEVLSGRGPIRLPSRAMLVVTRSYLFKIDRAGVRIIEAPEGSPLRRRLERMEEQRRRNPQLQERRGKLRERIEERGQGGPGQDDGRRRPMPHRPDGPPAEGQAGGPPPGEGETRNPPPPDEGERREPPPPPDGDR